MHYAQFRAVHAVAQYGGFSAAAKALGLTQPAISDAVRKLEQDYACMLFDRNGRRVTPTEFGRHLLSLIQPIFEAEAQAHALLTRAASLEFGTLSIIADAPDLAVALITAFRARHPHVQITLAIANAETCLSRLQNASIDLAVTAAAAIDARLFAHTLRDDPLMALVRKDSLPARQKSTDLAELAAAGLIFREPNSVTQNLLAAELAQRNLSATPALIVDGREAMVEGVAQGLGVGVIAASEYGGRRGVRAIPIRDCRARMRVSLLVQRSRLPSRLIAEFLITAGELTQAATSVTQDRPNDEDTAA